MDPQFGSGLINDVTDPSDTPYIYLTGPWIYLVMIFIIGVIIINFTMCLCITCSRTPTPNDIDIINVDNEMTKSNKNIDIYGQ